MITKKRREELCQKAKEAIESYLFSSELTDEELDYLLKKVIHEAVDCLVYDDISDEN